MYEKYETFLLKFSCIFANSISISDFVVKYYYIINCHKM